MSPLPRDRSPDSTLMLMMEGYRFISKRRERYNADAFIARVMGEKAVCIGGAEAAEIFYDRENFRRRDALPNRIKKSLVGEGAVHTLDGVAHENRKAMFLKLMTPESVQRHVDLFVQEWRRHLDDWEHADEIVLFDEAEQILFAASCAWIGIRITEEEKQEHAANFRAMVDAFGGIGPRHWRGRHARKRGEKWMEDIVRRIRANELSMDAESPAYVIASSRDAGGELLDAHTAAVEIMNLLRPTVAIAFFIAWIAHALHHYPDERQKLSENPEYVQYFVQEVRRFYPFTPLLGARVETPFDWKGHHFEPGTLVLLDVYGTDRDPKLWHDPDTFKPERFKEWSGSAYDFLPQGGGRYTVNHRCAGEAITVGIMEAATRLLVNEMEYQVPEQDLSYSLSRMPAKPRSGIKINRVQKKTAEDIHYLRADRFLVTADHAGPRPLGP